VFNNKVTRCPDALAHLTRLDDVNFGGNRLTGPTAVPRPGPGWASVTRLALQWNGITELPSLETASHLVQLQVNSNALAELPALGLPAMLATLDASKNVLTRLPANLGAWRSLVTLNVRDNKLTELPEFASLAMLETVNVENNALAALPASLGTCTALKTLLATGNRLTTIPATLQACTRLERLGLERNPLELAAVATGTDAGDEVGTVLRKLRIGCSARGGWVKAPGL
jgi:leucine-rich repeat protein SHOC2